MKNSRRQWKPVIPQKNTNEKRGWYWETDGWVFSLTGQNVCGILNKISSIFEPVHSYKSASILKLLVYYDWSQFLLLWLLGLEIQS